MELKPIRTRKEYQAALAAVDCSLDMIRRLADGLQLPAEILIKPYRLRRESDELAAARQPTPHRRA